MDRTLRFRCGPPRLRRGPLGGDKSGERLVLNPFARRRIYFRFDENEVHAVVLGSDRSYRERALVALKREGVARKGLAIGNDVLIAEASARELGTSGVEVINPFGNARVVVDDYEVADAMLRYVLHKLFGQIMLRPDIIMHPKRAFPGGLTPIEKRALHDLAGSAGGARVAVHEGSDLTLQEVADYQVVGSGR